MSSSRCLVFLALAVTSGIAIPLAPDSDDSSATLSPNDVDYRLEGLTKFARTHLAEGRSSAEGADIPERETSSSSSSSSSDESGEDEAPRVVDTAKDELHPRSAKKGRKHKAFFLNYPFVPQVRRYQSSPSYDVPATSHNDLGGQTSQKPGHRKRYQQESQIYYIKLPPTPYMFVPGIGYISQPPTFSTSSLQRPGVGQQVQQQRPHRPQQVHRRPTAKPFINVPIDFVSNGKPTGVYQWTGSKRPETSINSLNDGPYVFNGRPASLYLLTPDGQQTGHQPIRLADYSSKGYY